MVHEHGRCDNEIMQSRSAPQVQSAANRMCSCTSARPSHEYTTPGLANLTYPVARTFDANCIDDRRSRKRVHPARWSGQDAPARSPAQRCRGAVTRLTEVTRK